MFDAASPSEPPLSRMHGKAEIVFTPAGLGRLYQRAPLRVLFPTPPEGEPLHASLVTTSGGLTGGDRIELAVTAEPGARGQVAASAAEKLYRSTGPDTCIDIQLTAGDGSWLEVLPQETILFQSSRLRRATRLEVSGEARVLAGEMLVFGRTARGERLTEGLAREAWEVRRDGRLVWADALHLEGDIGRLLDSPAGLGGATACASLVHVGPDAAELLGPLRAVLEPYEGRAGATLVNGLLSARWLDTDAQRLRRSFGEAWAELRHLAAGLPRRLPRLWEI